MGVKLTDNQKVGMFKALATKSTYDVGIQFGLDKHYSKPASIKTKVYSVYREVIDNHEKFGLTPDTVDLVKDAVSNRDVAVSNKPKQAEVADINQSDVKSLTLGSRDKALKLIHRKLEQLESSPRKMDNESLVTLGKIFGILFDKAQIIQGQATEHVAVMGKIDKDMDPEAALQAVLQTREVIQSEKHG